MRKIGSEIATGVAIFIAIIIFIAGYIYLKNVTFRTDRYLLTVEFKDVTGLEPSDFVSVSGLRIGRVQNFRLNGLNVLVDIEVNPDIQLPVDSKARIKSLGMVGEKFVDIVPGQAAEMLQPGDFFKGHNTSDFSDIGISVETLLKQAEQFLDQLRNIIQTVFDEATQRDLKESLFHLRNLSSELDRNSSHLERSLVNLDEISTQLNEILSERRFKVESSIDNFHQASTKLEDLTNMLDSSLSSMQSMLAKIENQEGTVGKVIYRDELYNDIRHLTSELDTLVQDLKKRPQKYLNLGFIKVF
ncbi:MAG: MlaD family protein [bacterium]